MGYLSILTSIYQLDTLDTRLTTPSSVPYKPNPPIGRKESGHEPMKKDGSGGEIRTQPSRWNTPEFYLYYCVLLMVIPYMFWVAYDVSRPSDPRYSKYEHLLAPGWIPGRMIDASDPQYHTFRENLPYMAALLLLHPLCRRLWSNFRPITAAARSTSDQADARLEQRASFDFAFALAFLVVLHGFSASKVLLILYMNHALVVAVPRRYLPVATWLFNIGILFANELCRGYKFRDIASLLVGPAKPTDGQGPDASDPSVGFLVDAGSWLDSWGGLMSRWEILFNITVLRLISFNLDYYWSLDRSPQSPVEVRPIDSPIGFASSNPVRAYPAADAQKKKQMDPANLSERERVSIPAQSGDFSFRNYVAYAVYAPLYLTGPILTFNDYIHQQRHRPASIEARRTLLYALRLVAALAAMELVLHFDYVGAISTASPVWASYTAAQLSLLSYFNLHIIWLKLLLPWRLFRLWALLDGVDPPENIIRCVSNNFSTLSFWRAWHRSYNRWLIRYMYVPLGAANFGSWKTASRSMLTYVLIFTFVAMWHDIQLRLLIWGWLVVLFFIPEVTAAYLFPRHEWESRPTAYRMLCCAGAVVNVLLMISANLVGFAVGLDGLQSILSGIFHDFSGILFLVTACFTLFVGVQVMFEIRESESRKGIHLKC